MSDEGNDFEIETANGSFYDHYKRGLLDFLSFASQTARDAVESGRLQPGDLFAVERGLENLSGPTKDLFPLLAKRIDEDNPTFFDECTIEAIWNALGAVFLIAQHSGFTDSAKVYAHTTQSSLGGRNSAQTRGKIADQYWRDSCLVDAIAVRHSRPKISTAALGLELWNKMPSQPGKPAAPNTVVAYLSKMEKEGKLPKKIL